MHKLSNATARCRGSALISALFIMTLVAIAATAMSSRLQLDIYRTQLSLSSDELYFASQGVSFWAMGELNKTELPWVVADAQGIVRRFPLKLQSRFSPNVYVSGELYDLQSRFNLNNLSDKKYQAVFLNLLKQQAPTLKAKERQALVKATISWVQAYSPDQGYDQYRREYAKQIPPYLPAHLPFQSPSEFRMVQGVSGPLYQQMEKYISALPDTTPININTASIPLLKALGNPQQINKLVKARGKEGFLDKKKLSILLQKLAIADDLISLDSHYFMCIATAANKHSQLSNITIFQRSIDKNKKVQVHLLSESLNTSS